MHNHTANLTAMEVDPFSSLNESMIEEEQMQWSLDQRLCFILIFVHVVLSILSVTVNIFIAIIILRFKKLRTNINILLLNTVIVGAVCFFFTVIFFGMVLFELFSYYLFFLMAAQAYVTAFNLYVVTNVLLALDWFLLSWKPIFREKYQKYVKYILIALYIFGIGEYIIFSVYAYMHFYLRFSASLLMWIICLIILTVLNVMKRKCNLTIESTKNSYAFSVANIAIFSILPTLVFHFLFLFLNIYRYVPEFCHILPVLVWSSHPIYIAYILGTRNKYFRMAYNKCLKRSVRNYNSDGLDDISDDEDDQKDLVRVSLSKADSGVIVA